MPLLHGDATALIDYLPRNALIVLDDAEEIEDAWSELEEQALDLRHSAEEAGTLPPNFPLPYVTWDEWHEKLSHRSTLSLSDATETLDRPPAEQLPLILNVVCPNIIYPYLRSNVADIVQRAGFPPIHLAEINFEALYQQRLAQQQEEAPKSSIYVPNGAQ